MPFAADKCLALMLLMLVSQAASAAAPQDAVDGETLLETVEVTGQRVANRQPASTYAAVVTELRYDPQVDLQSRALPEGQADVTVRGGLFENTGFKIGAVTIFDPQTGHYSVELPVDPEMLSTPALLTDSENSLNAFNASLATVHYGYADIVAGGSARLGVGTDGLRFGSARLSHQNEPGRHHATAFTLAAAASRGDGTLPDGDHDFKRFSGHFQLDQEAAQSNIVIGYQDKFFGWPGMYTGFASLPETDHVKQGLIVADHRRSSANGWWQLGAAYRWLDDDYDFDRRSIESGTPGSYEHETRSFSLGLNGARYAAGADWNYGLTFAADRLVRSTDLTHGDFNSRSYLSLRLAPEGSWPLGSGAELLVRAGIGADISNRDEDALLPVGALRWSKPTAWGDHAISLDLSRNTQLPGYTALNSSPTGLFGGNAGLGREFADTLTLAYRLNRGAWGASLSFFIRRDDDLVDWTYSRGAPFARQANPVDMDVTGLEFSWQWVTDQWQVAGGYTYLDKDADYGAAVVDASYYALNFANHRATLAVLFQPVPWLQFRLDNEYRQQHENPLRTSDRRVWLASCSIGWRLPVDTGISIDLVADNLTDNDFEEFPGTPAYGRQLSLTMGLTW
jgi:hypothetical protein